MVPETVAFPAKAKHIMDRLVEVPLSKTMNLFPLGNWNLNVHLVLLSSNTHSKLNPLIGLKTQNKQKNLNLNKQWSHVRKSY